MKSPRIRYHITLPDAAPPSSHSTFAYLALLVVIANIAACLVAERATELAELEQSQQPLATQLTATAPSSERPGRDTGPPQLSLFERVDRMWRN